MKLKEKKYSMKKLVIGAAVIPFIVGLSIPGPAVYGQSKQVLSGLSMEQVNENGWYQSDEDIQKNFETTLQAIQKPTTRKSFAKQVEIAGVIYEFSGTDGDSTAKIIGYTEAEAELVLPDSVINTAEGWNEASNVTVIGSYAFSQKNLTSVKLPTNLEMIEGAAFTYNKLTNLVIPDSVESIGDTAFASNLLSTVDLGKNLETLGPFAFYNNSIVTITIPDAVVEIGKEAFLRNDINSLELGSSVKEIGKNAFGENQLLSVTIPNSVTELGIGAFYSNKLTDITIGTGIKALNQAVFAYNQLSSFKIPESINYIGVSALRGNNLTNLSIPTDVEKINEGAFKDNDLKKVTFVNGSEINEMGIDVFSGNPLVEIIVEEDQIDSFSELLTPEVMMSVTEKTVLRGEEGVRYPVGTDLYMSLGIGTSFQIEAEGIIYQLGNLNDYQWKQGSVQWFKDGAAIGPVGNLLSIESVSILDSGIYNVIVGEVGSPIYKSLPFIMVSVDPV